MQPLFILTLFWMLGGQPQVEARIYTTVQECQLAGFISVRAMNSDKKISLQRYTCTSTGWLAQGA
jgi:hypothetical protein